LTFNGLHFLISQKTELFILKILLLSGSSSVSFGGCNLTPTVVTAVSVNTKLRKIAGVSALKIQIKYMNMHP
jgi:hypothetical protein